MSVIDTIHSTGNNDDDHLKCSAFATFKYGFGDIASAPKERDGDTTQSVRHCINSITVDRIWITASRLGLDTDTLFDVESPRHCMHAPLE